MVDPAPPTAGPMPAATSAALIGLLEAAGFHVRAAHTYVQGKVAVQIDGFVTVSRYTDPAGRLVDWSARFAPGTPLPLISATIRYAGAHALPVIEAELAEWRVWNGRRLTATWLHRHEAQQLLDRVADRHPDVHAEHAITGEELAPTPSVPTGSTGP